jgi:hypothetical protein
MSSDLALKLYHDEALVLFELFARFSETDRLTLRHNSEFVALSRISAQLENPWSNPSRQTIPLD